MFDKEFIQAAFLVSVGTAPTTEQVNLLSTSRTENELFRRIAQDNALFKSKLTHESLGSLYQRRVSAPALKIDVDVTDEQLAGAFSLLEQSWKKLGAEEPFWSVLTAPQFKMDSIDRHIEEFYASGAAEIGNFLATLNRVAIDSRRLEHVLEIGCGVGRLTAQLSKHFSRVTAVDISAEHIRLAKEKFAVMGITNVEFKTIENPRDYLKLNNFDCIYSFIVLQHNPPPVTYFMLDKLFENARNEAVAYFQIPTYIEGYKFEIEPYLARKNLGMEMHCLPQPYIFRAMARSGFIPVEMQPHVLTDYRFSSYRCLARKI